MERSRVRELHYITDIANVPSILDHGILSHRLVERLVGPHITVASPEVQVRRAGKRVWTGRSARALHDYANLYLDARNAMLYTLLRSGRGDLTVLVINPQVLDLTGVLVTDRNAASAARFRPAAEGIEALNEAAVFATWWDESLDAKQRRMAEVLVPDRVPPELVRRAHVPDQPAVTRLKALLGDRQLVVRVNRRLFFRST
jgi:ssDNA thymidine ADP-ribosyltransferase DarT-like protein